MRTILTLLFILFPIFRNYRKPLLTKVFHNYFLSVNSRKLQISPQLFLNRLDPNLNIGLDNWTVAGLEQALAQPKLPPRHPSISVIGVTFLLDYDGKWKSHLVWIAKVLNGELIWSPCLCLIFWSFSYHQSAFPLQGMFCCQCLIFSREDFQETQGSFKWDETKILCKGSMVDGMGRQCTCKKC